jgi:hypothetical protein
MNKAKVISETLVGRADAQMASPGWSCSEMKARQSAKIRELRQALVTAGFFTLDKQTQALGLSRSTTWAVLNGNHKSSGVSAIIIKRMLASPNLPPAVRLAIEEYIHQKLLGAYGHDRRLLVLFRAKLGYPTYPSHSADSPAKLPGRLAAR